MNQSALIFIIIGGSKSSRCLYQMHLVWIYKYKARCSLQFRPLCSLPCLIQHVTITWFWHSQIAAHQGPAALTCIESHDCVLFPQLDRNSVTGLIAVSARTISWGFADASSILTAIQTCTHPPMPNAAIHNPFLVFWFFSKYSWSHLQPGALTCIESHDSVSVQHLDCNSVSRLTAVSAHNIWCGFVDIRLIPCCNTDL